MLLVSIPKWCDWSPNADIFVINFDKFQFLNGAIGVWRIRRKTYKRSRVSIPKWCDWSLSSGPTKLRFLSRFQFLNGAIGVLIAALKEILEV